MARLILLLGLGFGLALAAACAEEASAPDGTDGPAPTTAVATSTAEPSAERGGADGFREFAAEIQEALDEGDSTFFQGRIKPTGGICTEENMGQGIGQLPCKQVGEVWEGFPTGQWRSEGFIVPVAELGQGIAELELESLAASSDEFGDGDVRVYVLALSGDEADSIVTTLIERPTNFGGEGPLRIVRVLSWEFDGAGWRWTSLLNAAVLAEEFLIPCEEALNYLSGEWERYPDPSLPPGDPADCPI